MNRGVLLFKHLLNYNVFKFMVRLNSFSMLGSEVHKTYFIKQSIFMRCTNKISFVKSRTDNILKNCIGAVVARIFFYSLQINLLCL